MNDKVVDSGTNIEMKDSVKEDSESQRRMKRKYEKLKKMYTKLKEKFEQQEKQKQVSKSEIITIRDEPQAQNLTTLSSDATHNEAPPVIQIKNLSKIMTNKNKNMQSITCQKEIPTCLTKNGLRHSINVDPEIGADICDLSKVITKRKRKTTPQKSNNQKVVYTTVEPFEKNQNISEESDFVNEPSPKEHRKASGLNCHKIETYDSDDTIDYLPFANHSDDSNDETFDGCDDISENELDESYESISPEKKSKTGSSTKGNEKEKSRHKKGDGVFRCEECGKFLSSKATLQKHTLIHTGETPYQCHVCGRSFNSVSSLTNHTRIHDGIRPYKCRHCDKSFTESSHRTTHERTHTGEKPYMCDLCGGRFSLRSSLVRHRRIHTGEKPYKCEECGAAYCQYTQLTNHKKRCNKLSSLPTMVPLHQNKLPRKPKKNKSGERSMVLSSLPALTPQQYHSLGLNFMNGNSSSQSNEKSSEHCESINPSFTGFTAPHHQSSTTNNQKNGQEIDSNNSSNVTENNSFKLHHVHFKDPKTLLPRQHHSKYDNAVPAMFEQSTLSCAFSNVSCLKPSMTMSYEDMVKGRQDPKAVARYAMKRFTSMHPAWYHHNSQSD